MSDLSFNERAKLEKLFGMSSGYVLNFTKLMNRIGLVDTLLGIIIAYTVTTLPFCIWTMKGYYDTIPRDIEEAAVIDGTTAFGAFYRITLPLS